MERDVRGGGALESPAMRDRRTSALQVCVCVCECVDVWVFNLSPNLGV